MPMSTKSPHTILPIQYLRGIAAAMVVYHHTRGQINSFEPLLPGTFGQLGVDIFFVISGFIMFVTTARTPISSGEFVMRRIIRVAPLYWLLTCLMCAAWILFPSLFKTLIVTPYTFFQSLLFVPHYSLSFPNQVLPLLVPGWTLNYEMFFYLIFAIALILPRQYLLVSAAICICLAVSIGIWWGPINSALLTTYTSLLLLEFVAGMLIGKVWLDYQRGTATHIGASIFVFGCGILFVNNTHAISNFFDILGAAFIVAGSLNFGLLQWKNSLLKILGDASYAIYLSHVFTLGIIRSIWVEIFGNEGTLFNAIGFATVAMIGCLIVGVLVYACLEKPITRYLTQRFHSWQLDSIKGAA